MPFPSSPTSGELFTGPYGEVYEFDGVKWSLVVGGSGPGGGASISVGDSPPASPLRGALWFDTVGSQLYVFDTDQNQWIIAVNTPGVPSPLVGPILGVTDGSSAAPGEVGELLFVNVPSPGVSLGAPGTTVTIASLAIPAGSWLIWGWFQTIITDTTNTEFSAGINNSSTVMAGATTIAIAAPNLGVVGGQVPMFIAQLAATTTYYLHGFGEWSGGTVSPAAVGQISALRIR